MEEAFIVCDLSLHSVVISVMDLLLKSCSIAYGYCRMSFLE